MVFIALQTFYLRTIIIHYPHFSLIRNTNSDIIRKQDWINSQPKVLIFSNVLSSVTETLNATRVTPGENVTLYGPE